MTKQNYILTDVAQMAVDKAHKECDRLREELRSLKGERWPQRQDALNDQLKDVIGLAEQAGCYDAADFIRGMLKYRGSDTWRKRSANVKEKSRTPPAA